MNRASGERSLTQSVLAVAVRVRADLPLALIDVVLVVSALGAMLTLRFDGSVPERFWASYVSFLPVAIVVTLAVNWLWGLYGQIWRHASVLEARRILLAGGTTALGLVTADTLLSRPLPLSVAALGVVTSTMLAGIVRFQSRLFGLAKLASEQQHVRVAVLGANSTGAALVRDMLRSPASGLLPVVILDDDPRTHGRHINGVRVAGPWTKLPAVTATYGIQQAVLATPGAPKDAVRQAADLAETADVPLRILPDVTMLVGGEASVRDLRDLQIDDVLGRKQVETDLAAVAALLRGRRVLVTGAGGSIGSEIAQQVAAFTPAALLLLDHDETRLHDLCATLAAPATQLLADIKDRVTLSRIFDLHRPEVVFHAAAHKHVPVLEDFPAEAVRTNVLGTANVVGIAAAHGVERLVCISTDKAVRPTGVMGASKRLAEHVAIDAQPPGGRYCAVRFGNVLGSRGSVIPTFLRQIGEGGPVTITDPRMTRFFMSIPEAVQLVLQAAALSDGGEVFILEMGEPVRIMDLARRMIRLAGRRVGADVEIRVTGIRPGERLTEELHEPGERLQPTGHPSILMVRPRPLPGLDAHVAALDLLASGDDDDELRTTLFRLIAQTQTAELTIGP